MTLQDTITANLKSIFDPVELNVINESHLHAGHQPGFDGKGESHFRIQMVSASFDGLSRVARHRAVNEAMQSAFDGGLHALALDLAAPSEAKNW